MYPGRFWLGLGAGEALNEHIVGDYWPEAPPGSSMLFEAIEVISKLFTGKVVKHKGKHFTLESARLYTLPERRRRSMSRRPGPLNAERTGKPADGIITVGAADEKIKMLMGRFEKGAREAGKDPSTMPRIIQLHVSLGATRTRKPPSRRSRSGRTAAWRSPKQDIRNPEDFEAMAKFVRPENFKNRVLISADLDEHTRTSSTTSTWASTRSTSTTSGATRREFIDVFGREVLPKLRLG